MLAASPPPGLGAWEERVLRRRRAAQEVADDWTWRGWRFVGSSESEHLEEVLKECPTSWERAVGIFAYAFDRNMFQNAIVSSEILKQ